MTGTPITKADQIDARVAELRAADMRAPEARIQAWNEVATAEIAAWRALDPANR
jgi:hypothetical protein